MKRAKVESREQDELRRAMAAARRGLGRLGERSTADVAASHWEIVQAFDEDPELERRLFFAEKTVDLSWVRTPEDYLSLFVTTKSKERIPLGPILVRYARILRR